MVIVLLLGACGLTKEDLGMARSKPDETKVMKRAEFFEKYGICAEGCDQKEIKKYYLLRLV